jgi:hypothetical protein
VCISYSLKGISAKTLPLNAIIPIISFLDYIKSIKADDHFIIGSCKRSLMCILDWESVMKEYCINIINNDDSIMRCCI